MCITHLHLKVKHTFNILLHIQPRYDQNIIKI